MKVLQIGYTDLNGQRFNGTDLNKQLRKLGVRTEECVWEKEGNSRYTWELAESKFDRWLHNKLSSLEYTLSIQAMLSPLSWKLLVNKKFKKADLVHYHLIYPRIINFFSLPFLTKNKPSVWTLHDLWPVTGHCVHPLDCKKWKTGCGSCPYLKNDFMLERDLTAIMWRMKKIAYHFSKIELVVASRWMMNRVKQSPLLSNFQTHLIPFGVDTSIFKPLDKAQSKNELGIKPNSFVIGVRASKTVFKGFDYIKKCMEKFSTNTPVCILSFQEEGMLNSFKNKYQVIDLGWISDEEKLVRAYNACDVLLMPSRAESFGMMAIEAMACETTVLAFDGTALQEIIKSPKGGVVVKQGSIQALLEELSELLINSSKRKIIRKAARKIVIKHYSLTNYVNKHLSLYKNLVNSRTIRS